jgi:hypothetical protein
VNSLEKLRIVKVAHTVVWAVFAGCILAIPVDVIQDRIDRALLLISVVSLEVLVLYVNSWRCPLTAVAARYTDNRRDNFDIYLPNWRQGSLENAGLCGSPGGVLRRAPLNA